VKCGGDSVYFPPLCHRYRGMVIVSFHCHLLVYGAVVRPVFTVVLFSKDYSRNAQL